MFYDVYSELCKKIGKAPSTVAVELGINKSNVSNWKNNGYTPRGDCLNKIAEYFGIPVDYLLEGMEEIKYSPETSKRICNEVTKFREINPERFKFVMIPPEVWAKIEEGSYIFSNVSFPMFGNILGKSIEDFIWGGQKGKAPALTEKDKRDAAREVERIMSDLKDSGELMFDGVPISPEAIESLAAAMKLGLEAARLRNKETYTPKKYRK